MQYRVRHHTTRPSHLSRPCAFETCLRRAKASARVLQDWASRSKIDVEKTNTRINRKQLMHSHSVTSGLFVRDTFLLLSLRTLQVDRL
jgi:hypothetical protein